MIMKLKIFSLLVLFLASNQLFSIDENKPLFEQKPAHALVQDYAHFLTEAQDRKIEKKLNKLYLSTSHQILFITVNDLLGYNKNNYAEQLSEQWKIGGKAHNSIIILVQPKTEHTKGELAIQVGSGLENLIPKMVTKRIIEHEVMPNFNNGKYFRGIDAAINVLISITREEFTSDKYLERNGSDSQNNWLPFFLFILFILLLFVILKIRRVRHDSIGHNIPFWVAISITNSSKRFGGGFSNFSAGRGRFSGSGIGGFGGGGFGGGGAGGSW